MRDRLSGATEQFGHLAYETRKLVGSSWWRWGNIWFTESFEAIASYRINRAAFLALGPVWQAARVVTAPARFGLRPWLSGCEINYQADIGRGVRILHPTLGVVVSGHTVAGKNLILVGGNCIGGKKALKPGDIRIGNNVLLGANASVIGPITVGDNVRLGAGAVVVRDVPEGEVLLAPQAQRRASKPPPTT